MRRYARQERLALADLLDQVGPDSATCCAGWTTRDLAAHLVVRERRPDAALGIVVPVLRGYGERVRRRRARTGYPALVDQVRRPPWWSPVSNPLSDGVANGLEMLVHHEDVRRAQPHWQPRDLPAAHMAAIWDRIPTVARLALRRWRGTVLLEAPGWGQVRAGSVGATVRLAGAPTELLIFLSGRQESARVRLDGPVEATAALRRAGLGL